MIHDLGLSHIDPGSVISVTLKTVTVMTEDLLAALLNSIDSCILTSLPFP